MIEYLPVLIFLFMAIAISVGTIFLSLVLGKKNYYREKVSTYECGFEPFEDARNTFDIKFYIIAILFIIFDIEVTFLFPWAVSLFYIGSVGFWVSIDFMLELVLGYIYIWKKGALD